MHGGNDRSIHAFIPKNNSRTNKRKEYLERILKSKGIVADSDSVNNLLSAFWDRFLLKYGLLKNITNKNGYEGYRVNTEKLTIGNAKNGTGARDVKGLRHSMFQGFVQAICATVF